MRLAREHLRQLTRSLWAMVAFLLGFTFLLILIARQYLLPALAAASDADPGGRRQLAAVSALLLAIVLVILFIGLLLVFRVHRFFFSHGRGALGKNSPTEYTDAWTESGKRVQ
jgi:hypothetical protein